MEEGESMTENPPEEFFEAILKEHDMPTIFSYRYACRLGFDAATKYWFEPCTDHPDCDQRGNKKLIHSSLCHSLHRYLCPECRKEAQC